MLHRYRWWQCQVFCKGMLERLPNLTAVKIGFEAFYNICVNMPLNHLKHLELALGDPDALEYMPFAELFPLLETARISALEGDTVSFFDVSGCRRLQRLVLADVVVLCLSKPPQCMLRIEMIMVHAEELEASQLQPGFSEMNEALLSSKELYWPGGLVAKAYLPKLEVIRCDGWDDEWWDEDDSADDQDADPEGSAANALVNCMRHSANLPALKSILCGDHDAYSGSGVCMRVRIPADLAGVQELMIAAGRPLRLFFDSAQRTGERLSTFCAVGSEIRVDTADLQEMTVALFKRGLTLSMAQAGPEHENAPSQCLYVHACSMLQLSYDDAILAVNARVGRWGKAQSGRYPGDVRNSSETIGDNVCGQCGACFTCLRQEGVLDSY